MTWRLAKAIETVRAEVNAAYPDRPTGSDGTIGDARHAAQQSDHNPNPPHEGVVTAWDCTTDPRFTDALSEKFRAMGGSGDQRLKYIIFKARITSAQHGWQWAPYSGDSPHFDHIHLSVSDSPTEYDRTDPWNVFQVAAQTDHSPTPLEKPMWLIRRKGGAGVYITDWIHRRGIRNNSELNAIIASGVASRIFEVSQDVFDSLKEAK